MHSIYIHVMNLKRCTSSLSIPYTALVIQVCEQANVPNSYQNHNFKTNCMCSIY